jgi:hypothetical protein
VVEDLGVGWDLGGEAEDGLAVAGEGKAGLEGDAAIEVEFEELAGPEGLAVEVGEFPDYPEGAATFIVGQAAQRKRSSSCFKRGFSG